MLRDAKNAALLPEHLQYIADADVRDAFVYLLGLAASDQRFQCYGELKGAIRDFRFLDVNGQQLFSFIVNRESLLFYFRSPAVRSGRFALTDLLVLFPTTNVNNTGEWTVRIQKITEAKALWSYLNAGFGFVSGDGSTTQIGQINRNNQRCGGHRGRAGNDHLQRAYRMECLQPTCGNVYGANGSDVFQRKCPKCQGGEPGIEF